MTMWMLMLIVIVTCALPMVLMTADAISDMDD